MHTTPAGETSRAVCPAPRSPGADVRADPDDQLGIALAAIVQVDTENDIR
jgi:hypothetical protein